MLFLAENNIDVFQVQHGFYTAQNPQEVDKGKNKRIVPLHCPSQYFLQIREMHTRTNPHTFGRTQCWSHSPMNLELLCPPKKACNNVCHVFDALISGAQLWLVICADLKPDQVAVQCNLTKLTLRWASGSGVPRTFSSG